MVWSVAQTSTNLKTVQHEEEQEEKSGELQNEKRSLVANETQVKDMLEENPGIIAIIAKYVKEYQDKVFHETDELQRLQDERRSTTTKGPDDRVKEEQPAVLKPPEDSESPGAMGKPVILKDLTEVQEQMKNDLFNMHAFNVYASDLMGAHRTLPDFRDDDCKTPGRYAVDLPQTSIIICFYNEAWSILIRSIHSIMDRTPEHLLKEIILIDDFSKLPYLHEELENYLADLPKIKLMRTSQREGLVRCRLKGVSAAQAPILTFLDSHIEVTQGWLEPLLDVIVKDPTATAVPTIDAINDQTLEFAGSHCEYLSVGGFNFRLSFTWHPVPERDNIGRKPCDNVRSPTMAGGLFSISKDFFLKIGGYDEQMDVWGGENLGISFKIEGYKPKFFMYGETLREITQIAAASRFGATEAKSTCKAKTYRISFKIWMCGGSLMAVPCSHIGHLFRTFNPYARESVKIFGEFVPKNLGRVAKAWLDDMADYYFQKSGHNPDDVGDVTNELEVRRRLNCKSFSWYLDNVYPDLYLPTKALATGEVRNIGDNLYCLDTMGHEESSPPGVYPCHGKGGTQFWGLSKNGELRCDESCLDYAGQGQLMLYTCHGSEGNQYWIYSLDDHKLRHRAFDKCLGIEPETDELGMFSCDGNEYIEWQFEHINEKYRDQLHS